MKDIFIPFKCSQETENGGKNSHTDWITHYNIVSLESEGRYCNAVMFNWKSEGRFCCTRSMAIGPFWFSVDDMIIKQIFIFYLFGSETGWWSENVQIFFKTLKNGLYKILKALFNNVSTFKNSELQGPTSRAYMLAMSVIRCENGALKKLHLKSITNCSVFKEVKINKWPNLPCSFPP